MHGCGNGGEVDLRRQVIRARGVQRVGIAVGGDGLQRVAIARLRVTVVDEQRSEGRAEAGELRSERR